MTIAEAKQALKEGKKVTHKYFTPEEFIYEKDGKLKDESGCELTDVFWELRSKSFEDGWSIFQGNE